MFAFRSLSFAAAFALIAAATNAALSSPSDVASLTCVEGDAWTYAYDTSERGKPALQGSEVWTRTTCGSRWVATPSGKLVHADLVGDAAGNVLEAPGTFSGRKQTFVVPLPALKLPLAPGKSWSADVDVKGDDYEVKGSAHWNVTGWESVTVPAGTFDALRVETDWTYKLALEEQTSGTAGHRAGGGFGERVLDGTYHETMWYAPAARAVVKSVASNGFGGKANRELTVLALK